MTINCKICGKTIELPIELAEGQHVLCPYCGKKFSYSSSSQGNIRRSIERTKMTVKDALAKRRFGGKSLVFGGAVLLAVVLVTVIGAFVFGGKNSVGGFELDRQRVNTETCQIGEASVETALTSGEPGKAYFYSQGNLVVQQVIPKCGVLVGASTLRAPVALVLTERNYIDGVELRPGLYACIGTARYPDKDGFVKTVLAFEEAEPKVAQQRIAEIARQEAEEKLKRQKLAEEARLEREQAARAAREAAEEARIEAEKVKAETDAKLAKMRQEEATAREQRRAEESMAREQRRVEVEKQALEAKAKADAEAAEEAKKRYPIEQKMRAEYAASKISAISFDLKDYFIIEKALLSSLQSASVTENAWRQMKKAAKDKNWLDVLSVAAGEQLKDYPNTEEIDRMLASIIEREFHVEFKWNGKESRTIRYGVFAEENGLISDYWWSNSIMAFSIKNRTDAPEVVDPSRKGDGSSRRRGRAAFRSVGKHKGKILLYYDTDKIRERVEKYCDTCRGYEKAVELGKIDQATANQKQHDAFAKFKEDVLSIMARDGFKASSNATLSESESSDGENEASSSSKSSGGSRWWEKSPKKREIDPRLKTFR